MKVILAPPWRRVGNFRTVRRAEARRTLSVMPLRLAGDITSCHLLPVAPFRQVPCCVCRKDCPLRRHGVMVRVHTLLFSTEDKACVGCPRKRCLPAHQHALRGGRAVPRSIPLAFKGHSRPLKDPSTRRRHAHWRPALRAPSRGAPATGRWALPLWTPASGRFAALTTTTNRPPFGYRQRFAALDSRHGERHGLTP